MFRFLTYNIMRGGRGRVDSIATVINACAPDLVLLQEATHPANVERLAEATGMAEWRAFRRQSLAFLSRRPVVFSEWNRPRISRHAFIEVVPAWRLRSSARSVTMVRWGPLSAAGSRGLGLVRVRFETSRTVASCASRVLRLARTN